MGSPPPLTTLAHLNRHSSPLATEDSYDDGAVTN
jgi:hypothetical protein